MSAAPRPLVVVDEPAPGVRVGRFTRPDNMLDLHDAEFIQDSALYHAVRAAVLDGLPAGGAVVLNFGLVEQFPSAFFRLLIAVNQDLKAAGGRLLLCNLAANAREGYDTMNGEMTFPDQLRATEWRAVQDAKQPG